MPRIFFVVSAVFVSCAFSGIHYPLIDGNSNPAQDDDPIVVPQSDDNSIARRDFMRSKLMYSQNIFEGLTTGNFGLINAGIKEVSGITDAEKWVAIDNAKYRQLTADFKTTVKRLQAAAKTKNIEATALRYYQMSTSCIDCHAHIRVAQYEF